MLKKFTTLDYILIMVVSVCVTALLITTLLVQLFRYQYLEHGFICLDKLTGRVYYRLRDGSWEEMYRSVNPQSPQKSSRLYNP